MASSLHSGRGYAVLGLNMCILKLQCTLSSNVTHKKMAAAVAPAEKKSIHEHSRLACQIKLSISFVWK